AAQATEIYGRLNHMAMVEVPVVQNAALEPFEKIININKVVAAESVKQARLDAAGVSRITSLGMLIGFILALFAGIYLSRNIGGILEAFSNEMNALIQAAIGGKLATRGRVELINFEFRPLLEGVNKTLDAVIGPLNVAAEYIDRISKGDVPKKITDNYNGDFNEIKINLNNCIDNLNALVTDANMLVKAAVDGKLATRADANKHQGDYRAIVEGVNKTLDAVIGPLNVAAEYIDRISKGDVPKKITDSYNGDFNEIKINLNNCIDNLNALVTDANMLVKAAVDGKLATRADANKHQGDYRAIVEGVNKTLDAVIGPLNVAADYVYKISLGEIPPAITDTYNGDFNTIKSNLNECVKNLTRVATEIRIATDNVANGSNELSASAEQLSSGANDQASAAEEVSSSMEEMSSNIQQNADNAAQTEKIAQKAAADAKAGGKAVAETVTAMNEIASKIAISKKLHDKPICWRLMRRLRRPEPVSMARDLP
ncbi:MAG: hypothetical protein ACD_39C01725G0004, partial [uncultured bacterium]